MKYDAQLIGFITTFENITRASVKDAFLDKNSQLVFVVKRGDAGKAIGRNGSNIRRITTLFKKKVKIIEFNENIKEFIKNAIDPIKVDSIEENDKLILIKSKSTQTKASLIGRNKENLNELNSLINRYFGEKEIKVA